MKNKYKISTFIAAILTGLIITFLYLSSYEKVQEIYLAQTEKTIIDLRKNFLKDTVNNIFFEIDSLRESKYNNYKRSTASRYRRFLEELHLKDEDFIRFFKDRFRDDINPNMWTALLWNNVTGEIYYNSSHVNTEDIDGVVENLKFSLSSYATIEKGNIKAIFGVSKLYIDEIVKQEIGNLIRNREFSGGSYIWVNEVINYEGGDNYAIRRIHPNLIDTEGVYLSTDGKDIKGNSPYLEELEGVKNYGEIFYTYYFKELNSPKISEKISYAKLYKDYDWIIAMGAQLDEIDAYTEKINNEINASSNESKIKVLKYIFITFFIGFTVLFLIGKKHLLTSTKYLEKEINVDSVTKASSRRHGEANLNALYKQFVSRGENPAIMLFDIDDFKHINDNYGHDVGDIVLIEIVKIINHIIRSSDLLIRWGGDEFVGIFPGLREENIMEFGKKLLEGISSLKISAGKETISINVSMGFSYFKDTDNDFKDVIKRADEAMYVSKEQGKNAVNMLL